MADENFWLVKLKFYVQRYLIFVAKYINKIEKNVKTKKKISSSTGMEPGSPDERNNHHTRGAVESYLKYNIHSGTSVSNVYQFRLYGSPSLPKRLVYKGR